MIIKPLTEHHLEFLSLKESAEARPSLHLSKCQIVGNLMSWFKCESCGICFQSVSSWNIHAMVHTGGESICM